MGKRGQASKAFVCIGQSHLKLRFDVIVQFMKMCVAKWNSEKQLISLPWCVTFGDGMPVQRLFQTLNEQTISRTSVLFGLFCWFLFPCEGLFQSLVGTSKSPLGNWTLNYENSRLPMHMHRANSACVGRQLRNAPFLQTSSQEPSSAVKCEGSCSNAITVILRKFMQVKLVLKLACIWTDLLCLKMGLL